MHIPDLLPHDLPQYFKGRNPGAVSRIEPGVHSPQLLCHIPDQLCLLCFIPGLFYHMEAADHDIRIASVQLPEAVQDIQDSVMGASGDLDPLPLRLHNNILLMVKGILHESVFCFPLQSEVAFRPFTVNTLTGCSQQHQKYSLSSHAGVQLHAWQKLFTCVFP